MENENNFKETVSSLFKGMDGFVAAKTVVGDAIHVGDTIILPLVDVSFGVGAGAFVGEKKNNGGGGLAGKMTPCAVLVIQNGTTKLINVKNQDGTDQTSGYGSGFCKPASHLAEVTALRLQTLKKSKQKYTCKMCIAICRFNPVKVKQDFGMCFCRSEDRENLQKCSEAVSLHKIY